MEIIDIEQGSPEWLLFRKSKIGASEAAAICGVDPYKTPSQLWDEKVNGKTVYVTKAMQRGKDLEHEARLLAQAKHGCFYAPIVVQSDTHPWMIASLDGYDYANQRMIEIKCPNTEIYNMLVGGVVPKHYLYQMQHQMAVTGLKECVLFTLEGVLVREVLVHRDQELIDMIIEKEYAFYNSIMNSDPIEDPMEERNDDEAREAITAWMAAKSALEEAKEIESICRDSVLYVGKDKPFICKGVKVRKTIRPGAVDYSKIDVLKAVDLDKYRKEPVEYWTISLK